MTNSNNFMDIDLNAMQEASLEEAYSKLKLRDDLSHRLAIAFRYSGKERREITESTSINEAMISNYLQNKQKPSFKNVIKLAEFLDVNPAWLIGIAKSDIEIKRSANPKLTQFTRAYEERTKKMTLLLMRHLHASANYIEEYRALVKILFGFNGKGIRKITQYAEDLRHNPEYLESSRAKERFAVEEDFERDRSEHVRQYEQLIHLNDLMRKVTEDTNAELHAESFYGEDVKSLDYK